MNDGPDTKAPQTRATDPGTPEALPPDRERLERVAAALRTWLARIRRIPVVLGWLLWGSVASALLVAWLWFLRNDAVLVRWLAVPWLALAAVPQFGLWVLLSSVRELFELPDRLLALKSGVADEGGRVLDVIRRRETEGREARGFFATLREAYQLHGELAKVVATRAVLHRFTGAIAWFIGPISFVANCLIVGLAVLALAIAAP